MIKYSMVPINRRYTGDGKRTVRRILISYKKRGFGGVYKGVRLVAFDPYFLDPKSSQKYKFDDKYFYLVSDAYQDSVQSSLVSVKRPYQFNSGMLLETAIEFEAENDDAAIKIFEGRDELH